MATITFTQCSDIELDEFGKWTNSMPILVRLPIYESALIGNPDGEFVTLDENFILVAQWMRRNGTLKELILVSVCSCNDDGENESIWIYTDMDGDMLDDPHHGFFPQRLKYLR